MLETRTFSYDAKHDHMYIAFSDYSNSYGDVVGKNVMHIRNADTDEIVGYEISHFKQMFKEGRLPTLPKAYPHSYDDLYKSILLLC